MNYVNEEDTIIVNERYQDIYKAIVDMHFCERLVSTPYLLVSDRPCYIWVENLGHIAIQHITKLITL